MWGCIVPAIVVVLLTAGWFIQRTYYYTSGYKEAAGLPEVMAAVDANPTAVKVLGKDIQIVNMELSMPSNAKQNGHRIFYKVRVKGSKASGEVQTSVLLTGSQTKITSLTLIGPDKTNYRLMRETP